MQIGDYAPFPMRCSDTPLGPNLNGLRGLCQWQDVVARTEDESTGYILPNKTLLEVEPDRKGLGSLGHPETNGEESLAFISLVKGREEIKLDQIRSSVNLPFHSFSTRDEQPKAVKEKSPVLEVQSEEPPPEPSARSNTEDVIMLEDDVNEEEQHMECLQSVNKNRKPGKLEKAENHSGFSQIRPSGFEAARKQIRFGEAPKEESVRIDGNQKNPRVSGDKKKSSAGSQSQKDEGTGELSQGKCRFAFPATGNRSATFH
ncbi:hypothetical protein Pint_20000 [Pistacia integerrima]|uniref:Uncharacterized protein n=1 Tax=Pistacia integerrima TaxID=434235 RepID=A0ACC0X919_9ROSI|nr:hypothetical protein Pint_20000 [Pistacia integerrima]